MMARFLPVLLVFLVMLSACGENPGVDQVGPDPRARLLMAHGLDSPSAMAFDRQGRLYVAEEQAGQIVCISPDGTRAVLAHGLERPCALCVDRDGNVVAAESDGRLVRIAPDGSMVELAPAAP